MQDFEKRCRRLGIVKDEFAVLSTIQSPDAAEEAIDAFESLRVPRLDHVQRPSRNISYMRNASASNS